jgi:hypothetical protein
LLKERRKTIIKVIAEKSYKMGLSSSFQML